MDSVSGGGGGGQRRVIDPMSCPSCGVDGVIPLYWKAADAENARPGVKPPDVSGYQIVACAQCGLGRVDPMPSADELTRLYAADYYQATFTGRVSDPLVQYLRPPLGSPTLLALRERGQRAYEDAHVADLARWYGEGSHLTPLPPSLPGKGEKREADTPPFVGEGSGERSLSGLRFLDVGCGAGGVLQAAVERGWDAVGVEPSASAARLATARGVRALHTTLEAAHFDTASFDLIHIREVLEHVTDPLGLLHETRRVLRPGGMIYIQVPNDLAGYRRWVFRRVWWLIPPLHLWYFTFESLAALLRQAGFVVTVRGTLGLGVGYDVYRYLGAATRVLGWLDREEFGRWALLPRVLRAGFKLAGAPADWLINRSRCHSSLWVCATTELA